MRKMYAKWLNSRKADPSRENSQQVVGKMEDFRTKLVPSYVHIYLILIRFLSDVG